jgi:alpha-galactosidase
VEALIAKGDRIFDEMREDSSGTAPLREDYFKKIGGEHEQVLEIIESIRHDSGRTYSANLPNQGQIPNLPQGAIVECPAVADGSGMRALQLPPLASSLVGTLATRFAWVETVVEAALEGSREKFIQALVLDGCVDSLRTATALADELLEAQAAHLPQFARAERPAGKKGVTA